VRRLSYAQAIREAHAQLLASDPRVFLLGQGLWSPWYAGSSLDGLDVEFGRERVVDSPVSENAVTGLGIGAALTGLRPIVFHPRMDFMLLAMDPIVNQAANWCYLFAGQVSVPIVIRAVINRGGEQGAQHSQALHAMLMHVPGLKVVMPSTPYDAKGLLMSAYEDPNPIIYIDDRWLYDESEPVPVEPYSVPLGKAAVRRTGSDITLIGISWMAKQNLLAAGILARHGIEAEVIDLRTLKPWDRAGVFESVAKTGRAVVSDPGWRTAGAAADIAAEIGEEMFSRLRAPVKRVTLPDTPAPTSRSEEAAYYPGAEEIARVAASLVLQSAGSGSRDLKAVDLELMASKAIDSNDAGLSAAELSAANSRAMRGAA
jgi:pyruvate/2-oxoglutarate/acetoin dehydrogenase E1 component